MLKRINWSGVGIFVMGFLMVGMVPGGSYSLFNASSGIITVELRTIGNPHQQPYRLMPGHGDGGSGDDTKLIWLAVTLPTGKRIVLDEKELDRRKAASNVGRGLFSGHGAWWIDDSGITFISSREANIQIGRFQRNKKK